MPQRSSAGRPLPCAAPRPSPVRNHPQPATHALPPAPVQGGGSIFGGIGSTIAQVMAFGTGGAVAHSAVDVVLGPRTFHHETITKGFFEVTHDVSHLTCADFLHAPVVQTPVIARFSIAINEQGSPETSRDPRGFTVKSLLDDDVVIAVGKNAKKFVNLVGEMCSIIKIHNVVFNLLISDCGTKMLSIFVQKKEFILESLEYGMSPMIVLDGCVIVMGDKRNKNFVMEHFFLKFKQSYHDSLEGEKKKRICSKDFLKGFARKEISVHRSTLINSFSIVYMEVSCVNIDHLLQHHAITSASSL